MVRVSDLGYQSKNLETVPSKEDKKKQGYDAAIRNLASPTPPSRLSKHRLPDSLLAKLTSEE